MSAASVLDKCQVDDPVNSIAVHGVGGFMSLIYVGVFSFQNGLLYKSTDYFQQLGIQFLGASVVTTWALVVSFLVFNSINQVGRLRIPHIFEIVGVDFVMHTEADKLTPELTEVSADQVDHL